MWLKTGLKVALTLKGDGTPSTGDQIKQTVTLVKIRISLS